MSLSLAARFGRACLLACSLLALTPALAAPPPVADFFANDTYTSARLAPDGRAVAFLVNSKSGYDRLAVYSLTDGSVHVVAEFSDADVGNFEWVNSERLVYDSRNRHISPAEARFYAPGLFAVNRDGSGMRRLVDVRNRVVTTPSVGRPLLPWNTYLLGQKGAQNSNSIYVAAPEFANDDVENVDLLRLDTVTGRATTVKRPGNTRSWWLDAKGEPRLATVRDNNVTSLLYLDPSSGNWRKLTAFDTWLGGADAFMPLGFSPQGKLYVVANKGGDKRALFAYDLVNNKLDDVPLVRLQEYDFSGALVATDDKLLGVHYVIDAAATTWFDARMKQVQADVDAKLPNLVNLIGVAARAETPWVLVNSYSDRQPRVLSLYNTETHEFKKIGDTHPRIKAADMAALDLVQVTARDGLTIPTWLTVPNNSKGKLLPLVVLVHGGPYVRGGEWSWRSTPQFLASRGYAVIEPEFRGSTGYGNKHFRAGWKQWGLAMQDDIADAARWAIAKGIADPKRICIAGASYGGYATLMGLIRDPDLYKCGIDWAGVTDIELLYTGTWWSSASDMSASYKQYGMPALVGDRVKDAAQLEATSPLKQAARITQPLLLAYGGIDKRVPMHHGRKFYDAVKQTNKDVEWVVYDDEGHGWRQEKTNVDFWTRVEKFLNRHIGTP